MDPLIHRSLHPPPLPAPPSPAPAPGDHLTLSDRAALRDLTRFGLLGATHLAAWHFGPPAPTAARLTALVGAGLVRVFRPRYAGRDVYLATAAGARGTGTGLRPPRFAPALATHHLAVADVALTLLRHYPGATWITERELRQAAAASPTERAYASHPPDGALVFEGRRLAVEVELTAKGPASYRRILRWYAGALEFGAVVWFCPRHPAGRPGRLFELLERLIREEGVADIAAVRPLPSGVAASPWG